MASPSALDLDVDLDGVIGCNGGADRAGAVFYQAPRGVMKAAMGERDGR